VARKELFGLVREQPGNALGFEEQKSYSYTLSDETRPVSVAVRLGLPPPPALSPGRSRGRR